MVKVFFWLCPETRMHTLIIMHYHQLAPELKSLEIRRNYSVLSERCFTWTLKILRIWIPVMTLLEQIKQDFDILILTETWQLIYPFSFNITKNYNFRLGYEFELQYSQVSWWFRGIYIKMQKIISHIVTGNININIRNDSDDKSYVNTYKR